MAKYTLQYVYAMSDFHTSGPFKAPPHESGSQTSDAPLVSLALDKGAAPKQITIADDDANFNEIGDASQILTAAITLDSVSYPVGANVTIKDVLTTEDGFEGYAISIGPTNGDTTTAFITNSPMVAGQRYMFSSEGSVGNTAVPYSQFACFTAGTLIKTERGERAIDELKVGDRVMTRDHGLQAIRWAGSRTVAGIGQMAPITFDTGTLGCSAPLTVSPNHRMLISGAMAELVCGDEEILLSAKMLVNDRNVRKVACGFVTYVHIMFDYHEIIWANDCPTESFYIGNDTLTALKDEQAAELLAIFPDLRSTAKKASLARAEGCTYESIVIAATL